MRAVSARAYEETVGPARDRIVILLEDVERPDSPCPFRLLPAGADDDSDLPDGWPRGEIEPVEIRSAADGIELVVERASVEAGALVPGMPVCIELVGQPLRAEFPWPELPPPARKRPNIVLAVSRDTDAPPLFNQPAASRQPLPITAEPVARPPALAIASRKDRAAMSRKPSPLDQLDALDMIADLARAPAPEPMPEPISGRRPAAATPPAVDPVETMLVSLKRDIAALKREQGAQALVRHDGHVYELLMELKRDIADLQHEQAPPPVSGPERQLYEMLAELRHDIDHLRHEQGAPTVPAGERQLRDMLRDLRRDIDSLRHDSAHDAPPAVSAESELREMLRLLRRDIEHLGHDQRPPVDRSAVDAELQEMLAELRLDILALQHQQQATPLPAGQLAAGAEAGNSEPAPQPTLFSRYRNRPGAVPTWTYDVIFFGILAYLLLSRG